MRVGSAFLQTFTTQVLQSVASILTGVLIARALGPTGQGFYAVFAAAIGLGVVAASVGQFEGNVLASASREGAGRILLVRSIIQCILTGLILVATIPLWTRAVPAAVRWMAPFFICVLALEVLAALIRGINLGQHHIVAYNLTMMLQRFCYLVAVGGLAIAGLLSLKGIVVGWAVAVGISASVGAVWIWSRSRSSAITWGDVFAGWSRALAGGLRPWTTIILSLILVRCDTWMLGPMLGVEAVGQMSVASSLAEYLWYIPSILGNLLFARAAADRGPAVVQTICRACRSLVVLLVPVVATLLLVGRRLVPLIYGEPFAVAGQVLIILLPGVTALALYLVVDSYFAGAGFPPISILAVLGALIVKISLNWLVVPSYGVLGAAGATSLAYGVLFLVKLVAFIRRTNASLADVLWPRSSDLRENLAVMRAWASSRSLVRP